MSETWGKGTLNNTIGWGQGACDNTINWGKSQKDSSVAASWSGDTDISGCSGAAGLAQIDNLNSMSFDNLTNDVINCGNDSSLQITGAMTVSYWFKGQGGSGTVGGVGKLGNNGSRGFCLGMISSGTITFFIAPTASSLLSASYSHTTDTNWHHIVGVFNPSTSLELYFDGQLVDTTSTSTSSQYNASNNLQIGARGDSNGFFNGLIDETALFNVALTDAEILSIYNATAVVGGVKKTADLSQLTTPPVAWYRM